MEDRLLEVGDVVFSRSYGQCYFFGKIDRVTNKTAFIRDIKFNRKTNGRDISRIGQHRYQSLFIPTEADKLELRRIDLTRFVVNFDYSKLDYGKIEEIANIIKRKDGE